MTTMKMKTTTTPTIPSNPGALSRIEKKFGKGSIFRLDSLKRDILDENNYISTGSYCLNEMLTGNYRLGYPAGRVIEIYGPEGVGKSTLALHAAKEVTKKGGDVLYLDVENGLSHDYAEKIGVDPEHLIVSQPGNGEDAFEIANQMIAEEKIPLVVVDSVALLVPRAEVEGEMDANLMGAHARLMGKGVRKMTGLLRKSKSTVIFINQLRMKIGNYGNPETTTGGNILKFQAWLRIDVRAPRSGKVVGKGQGSMEDVVKDKDKEKVELGKVLRIKSIKNKSFPPYRTCNVKINYGEGIDKDDDLLRFFESRGIITIEKKKIRYRGKKMLRKTFLAKAKKEYKARIKKKIKEG